MFFHVLHMRLLYLRLLTSLRHWSIQPTMSPNHHTADLIVLPNVSHRMNMQREVGRQSTQCLDNADWSLTILRSGGYPEVTGKRTLYLLFEADGIRETVRCDCLELTAHSCKKSLWWRVVFKKFGQRIRLRFSIHYLHCVPKSIVAYRLPAHIDDYVSSQLVFKILSLSDSLENLRWW